MEERAVRWRLVLGEEAELQDEHTLQGDARELEKLLQPIYGGKGQGGFGRSSKKIKDWLDGIRKRFPQEVVQLMQSDALERQGVREMLLEPELLEKIEPSVSLVSTILQLQHLLPGRTKSAAQSLVRKLVQDIERKLKIHLYHAAQRSRHPLSKPAKPEFALIDWKKTIHKNLKHYQESLKTIIPQNWYGHRKSYRLPEVYILVDKSESMVGSMIYASVIGSVLASLKSIETHLIFFDTEVSDVSGMYEDPVDLLFATACGGGTDISKAMLYVLQNMTRAKQSLVFLISDLYEGGNKEELISSCAYLKGQGASLFSLLSLSDEGEPEYDHALASRLRMLDIPCFACSPDRFPELLAENLHKI